MSPATLTLPPDLLEQLLGPELERRAAAYFATLPAPDPQYPVARVAEILGLSDEATVRGYLELGRTAPDHPRRLAYVDTTGHPRGYRVPLSEIRAWQLRNRSDYDPAAEVPPRRPASRRKN